jgi:hypothetical protein
MRKSMLILLVVVFVSSVYAQPTIYVDKGRPYVLTVTEGSVGMFETGESWETWCLERDEYIYENTPYFIESISDMALGGGINVPGGTGDPLGDETAWLYDQFRKGTLPSYDGSYAANQSIQEAIWFLEGELTWLPSANAEVYRDLAVAAVAGGWTNDGKYKVVNLYYYEGLGSANDGPDGAYPEKGIRAQSFIIPTVPTPGAVVLGSIGIGLVGWVRRRKVSC